MSRTSTAIGIVAMFGLALGAGIVGGRLSMHSPASAAAPPTAGSLSDELGLSSAQQEQMRSIWEQVGQTARDCQRQADTARQDEDKAMASLLTEEQRNKWKQLSEQTAARIALLKKQRDDAFAGAVKKTHGILSESQRQLYDQIVRDRVGGALDGEWEHLGSSTSP